MAQDMRFELVNTLGRGGMAEVFLGWMHSVGGLRRKVAIKRILPELIQKQSKLFQQMFVDEARLAFQLEHDNIVRVYDVGQTANTYFIVMEYIEGFDLKTIMERMRALNMVFPVGLAVYIALQVCAGLGYAHTLTDSEGRPLGLIHNDISPPNILIGRYGEVKVADFGLSDASSNDVSTPEGMIKGKFAYISPEGTRNPPHITSKSDIFSIGICLWEMLAGRRLFQRETDLETFCAVQAAVIPDLKRINKDIPNELIHVVHKALSADPAKRYQTCEALYLDLSVLAAALGIPLNRYDLSWLVNELAGNRWSEFMGEKVSADVQKTLQDELGGMLPPGDAEALGEIVTGISVAEDVGDCSSAHGNWVQDVFDDLEFDEGEVVFAKDKPKASSNASKPSTPPGQPSQPGGAAVEFKPPREQSRNGRSPVCEVSGMLPSAKLDQQLVSMLTSRHSMQARHIRRKSGLAFLGAGLLGVILGGALVILLLRIFGVNLG
ncbi:MAG: serine/threonine protein kinase [Proteobacteria bacterium]|nr:serine/threonine protein kinase [Pseudomonadota bacterium]